MKKQQKRIMRFASLVVILALVLTMNVPNFSVREVHAEEAQTFKITTDRPMLGEAVTTNADQETMVKWYIDDHMVSESKQYIPDESTLEKWITAKAYIGDEQIGEDKFYFSKLPVIYINTDDSTPITTKETYVSADMFVQGNKQYDMQYNGRTQIKLRGNISTSFEQKPYKLKLEQSTDMFGFGKNKHWVLLSNYVDQCSLRNKISTELGEKLGVCSMKATQVDVIINGEFAGMYNFFEQIRVANTRVNIKNWEDIAKEIAAGIYDANKGTYDKTDKKNMEDELCADLSWVTSKKYCYQDTEYNIEGCCKTSLDISGGYLFEMSEEYDEVSKFTTSNGTKVMLKSPENLYTNESMMDYVKSYWNNVEEALSSQDGYNTKGQNYKELVDVDSMVAYWLTQEIMGNNDAQEKSRFAYKDTNGKLAYGPIWDFDWGGGSYTVGDYAKEWVVSAGSIWNTFIDDPYFQVKAIDKYWSVRAYLQSIVEDDGILDQYYELLKEAGAANDTKYQEDSFYGMLRRNFDTDFQTYKTYFKERLAWLDEQFASYQSLNISLRLVPGSPYPYVKDDDLKIRFQNVQEDTQSKIKADGVIASNKNLNLNIEAANADQISVYVNADKVYEQKIEQGKVQYTLPKKLLTEEYGTKNVIAVIAKNSAGVVTATNYATIIVKEAADEDSDEEEETTITVKYMDSDGSYLYAPQQIKTTEKVNKPEDPVKNGYQFVGWYCDINFAQEYDFTSKPEQDVDLYAKWKANDYTITYHLDGGKNDTENPTSYTINDNVTFLNPTRMGYTFEGWYNSSDFKTKVLKLEKGSVGAVDLYAKWTVNNYAITYHLDGGKNDTKNPTSYTINDSITFLNPTRTGYTFEGWYSSSDFKAKVLNLGKGSVGEVDLYAKWTVNDYAITYHLNGGENDIKNPTSYTINDSVTFLNPTRIGYTFEGWYSSSDFKTKVLNLGKGSVGAIDLYAKWTVNDYAITYHVDGGKNDAKNPTSYTINDSVTFSNPTRTGYTFEGWYSSSDFKTKVQNIEKGSVGVVELYAKWTVNNYAITYHLNGGKNDTKNPTSYIINDGITFSNPTRTGYTFEGWYSSSDFKTKILNLEKGSVGAVDLYAKWTVNDYTIAYHLNGGKNDPKNPASYTINDSVIFSNPTRKGYIFAGWYTTSYKKKVTGIAHGTTGDTAVYAMWKTDPKYVYLKYAKVKKIKAQKYTGKKIRPNVVITLQGKKLRKNKDYKLTYSKNVKVGKAKIKITGKGRYKGTRKVTFRIKKVRGKKKW